MSADGATVIPQALTPSSVQPAYNDQYVDFFCRFQVVVFTKIKNAESSTGKSHLC